MATATIGSLTFTQIDTTQTCSVTKNGNPSGSIDIPNLVTINGEEYQVTSIPTNAFFNCSGLTNITIPNSVTRIGDYSFYECIGLTSVTIGTGVTSISYYAFYNCPSSIKMYFLGSTIPTLSEIFGVDWNSWETIKKGKAYYLPNGNATIDTDNRNKLTPYFTTLNRSTSVVCFASGSKILTDEGYKNIETLRRGDKVKTLKDGCKEIKMIGNMSFINDVSSGNPSNRIYKLSKEQYPELTEDLYVTGLHPILVDESSKCYNSEDGKYIIKSYHTQTDGKYRLPCCTNENAELIKEVKEVTVWDFVLENDSDVRRQYGIWANGLLTETLDEYYFKDKNLFSEV